MLVEKYLFTMMESKALSYAFLWQLVQLVESCGRHCVLYHRAFKHIKERPLIRNKPPKSTIINRIEREISVRRRFRGIYI